MFNINKNIYTVVFLPISIFKPLLVFYLYLLPMPLLTVVTSLSLLFFMYSSSSCINTLLQSSVLASPLPSSFLHTYSLCHLSEVKLCVQSLFFLSFGPFDYVPFLSYLRIVPSIPQEGLHRFLFLMISSPEFDFEKLSHLAEICFSYFFFFHYGLFASFSHNRSLVVFKSSLRNSKSPHVYRILRSILADLNNALLWMILPLISNPSSFFMLLQIIPSDPITIGITVILIFHSLFTSSLKV